MFKRLIIIFCALIPVFGVFAMTESYLIYFYPHDVSLSGYFSGILESISPSQSDKLIRINLYNKALALYQDGSLIKQTKISAAGHPKYTPTPSGDYKILSKEKKHVSGISGLIMPLSMRFRNDGYYLQGLPLNRAGQIINTTYSNGCIRLAPGLDQEVYDWADIGTELQVYNAQLVRAADDPTVYLLTQDGSKKGIPSPEVFAAHGFNWSDIAIVPMAEILNYSEAGLVE